jgi:hypothetical protein
LGVSKTRIGALVAFFALLAAPCRAEILVTVQPDGSLLLTNLPAQARPRRQAHPSRRST